MAQTTIDQLTTSFRTSLTEAKPKNTTDVVTVFRQFISANISQFQTKTAVTKGKGKTAATKGEPKPMATTWNRIFTSVDFGFKKYFPDDYQRIKDEQKLTHFAIISTLRTELENEPDRTRWNDYIAQIQELGGPTDPPSDRKPKEVKPTKATPKAAPKPTPKPAPKPHVPTAAPAPDVTGDDAPLIADEEADADADY